MTSMYWVKRQGQHEKVQAGTFPVISFMWSNDGERGDRAQGQQENAQALLHIFIYGNNIHVWGQMTGSPNDTHPWSQTTGVTRESAACAYLWVQMAGK